MHCLQYVVWAASAQPLYSYLPFLQPISSIIKIILPAEEQMIVLIVLITLEL